MSRCIKVMVSVLHQLALLFWFLGDFRCSVSLFIVVLYCIVLLFYVHGKHLRSCQDGQLT